MVRHTHPASASEQALASLVPYNRRGKTTIYFILFPHLDGQVWGIAPGALLLGHHTETGRVLGRVTGVVGSLAPPSPTYFR